MPPQGLTLKQRLAALSLAPSSSTAPPSPTAPQSPSTRKRGIFGTQWGKRSAAHDGHRDCADRVQEVISKMIFQAGVDYETRPMVVITASALPDPKEVSYDMILTYAFAFFSFLINGSATISRILSYLDLFVESDYTLVFLAAGGRHTPGWNWVWKAYRSLSRKYRKNLKRLYIVHSSFFSKMLFSLAGAIISPKFFRKITYIDTLSELAYHVPLTQIDVPPAVYQENLKHEDKINLPTPSRANMFGVPLEELMGYDGEKDGLPRVVKDCVQFLRDTGMEEEGLFRRSPNSVLLRQVQEAYDRGQTVSLQTFDDPHLAAVLLKKFFRDLPDPLFPEHLYGVIRRCPPPTGDPSDISTVVYIRETLLPELPPCSYILLSHVLHLMHDVSLRASYNLMDARNLAIVLSPNLVSSGNPMRDVMICAVSGGPEPLSPTSRTNPSSLPEGKTTLGTIIKTCIQRYFEIFDEVQDRSEAIAPASLSASQSTAVGTPSNTSSASASPTRTHRRILSMDTDEEIDDAMLVMPIGPSTSTNIPGGHASPHRDGNGRAVPASPPSAWATPAPYKPRHRRVPSGGANSDSSGIRSMYTGGATRGGSNNNLGTMSKAKSLLSIERGPGETVARRGPMTVGKGTARKSSGAGVSAVGVTAAGFFTPPSDTPPLPSQLDHRSNAAESH